VANGVAGLASAVGADGVA